MTERGLEPPRPTDEDGLPALTDLEGVGPARAERLARMGIESVRDLLFLLPSKLVEWQGRVPLGEAAGRVGEDVVVVGTVESFRLTRMRGRRSLVRCRIEDAGGFLDLRFWNQPWVREQLRAGLVLEAAGRVSAPGELTVARWSRDVGGLPGEGDVEPRYPSGEGLGPDFVARLCRTAAERYAGDLREPLGRRWLERLDLPPLPEAVRTVHGPSSRADFVRARRRLALEPLVLLQTRLAARRAARGRTRARRIHLSDEVQAEILSRFPYELTRGQREVVADLRADLERGMPMRRLLQGDVGVGKTAVALWAAYAVGEAGGQVAFMAPTELLAEQHQRALAPALARVGLRGELLTGRMAAGERRQVEEDLARGAVDVVFGTHALFSPRVRYRRLDLAIVDEQHRFGVGQRAALARKGGDSTHLLLMTATPIPRTLAMTLYGDLDVSILRDAPPGRGRLTTHWVRGEKKRRLLPFLEQRLAAGERVYWVLPRIGEEGGEDLSGSKLVSAEERHAHLRTTPLAAHGLELVHGRLDPQERAWRLERFRRGEIQTLVATTVVEVGVDVPEATVMVIEHAERFGLAQLHQLRGRVGRGPSDSRCLLLGAKVAAPRLELLERTRDGFEIAEEDLRLRGMGDLTGRRQAGENAEGLAELEEADVDLLLAARDIAAERVRPGR